MENITSMEEESCSNLRQSVRHFQLMKKLSYHSGVKCFPYEALFCFKVKIKQSSSNLLKNLLKMKNNYKIL